MWDWNLIILPYVHKYLWHYTLYFLEEYESKGFSQKVLSDTNYNSLVLYATLKSPVTKLTVLSKFWQIKSSKLILDYLNIFQYVLIYLYIYNCLKANLYHEFYPISILWSLDIIF